MDNGNRGSEVTVSIIKDGAALGIFIPTLDLYLVVSPLGRFVVFDEGHFIRLEDLVKEAA
jgi:hypothetical protein